MSLDKVHRIRDFIFFRFARLYPTFWLCAAITFLVMAVAPLSGRTVSPFNALMNISMLPITTGFKPIDPVYWSLEVELFFYGLMAALVALGFRLRIIPVLTALVAVNLIFLALPGPVTELPKLVKLVRLTLSMRYLHFFLFGIVCYELYRARLAVLPSNSKAGWPISTIACVLCVVTTFVEAPLDEFGVTVVLGVLFYCATTYRIPPLNNSILLTLGACSYPLYTIHQNIGYTVIRRLESLSFHPLLAITCAAALVISISIGISRWVELPSNKLLRRLYLSRKRPDISMSGAGATR
jgi:peptidoglycan/LPS O-acetylase OafA/YrhL